MIVNILCAIHGIVSILTIKDYPIGTCPHCYDEDTAAKIIERLQSDDWRQSGGRHSKDLSPEAETV